MHKPHRDTIFLEQAKVLDHQSFGAQQYVMRLYAPKCAVQASAGSFVHLQCDPLLPMRRPFSIMRSSAREGWLDVLYKVVGDGSLQLAKRQQGETLSCLGPIGNGFSPHAERPRALLLGGGVGIPPMIFLAEQLRLDKSYQPLVIMGSEIPFPFTSKPSQIMVPGMPDGVIAAMPLLEDWGIASRLTSLQGYAGCHQGYITDLARHWLDALQESQHGEVEIFACGPQPMLAAVGALAQQYNLPCQVSLEEFMACAVGGCAGCVVEVKTEDGPVMKRVCVDGPVFDAAKVF